jgi:hypothetical protein
MANLRRLTIAVSLAAVAALTGASSVLAQGVGSDDSVPIRYRNTSGDLNSEYHGDLHSNGSDYWEVTIGGDASGGDGAPVGPLPCVSGPLHLTKRIDLPQLSIRTWPEHKGIVGTPTFFWVDSEGFDGNVIKEPAEAWYTKAIPQGLDAAGNEICLRTVEYLPATLEYWPVGFRWDFGDNSRDLTPFTCERASSRPAACRLGMGRPESGDISHVYEFSSMRGADATFQVSITVDFRFDVRIFGQAVYETDITQMQTRELPVEQIQTLLTR